MGNKESATYWYNWGITNNKPCCGYGSTPDGAKDLVNFLELVIPKYKIESVVDCGCGYFGNWTHNVKGLDYTKYLGLDINTELTERNKKEFPNIFFLSLDFVNCKIPETDLIICRDVLFHLPTAFVIQALENFKKSKSKYLLSTTFPQVIENCNLPTDYIGSVEKEYGYRDINLEIEPYNLGKPIFMMFETKWNRWVALWKINEERE